MKKKSARSFEIDEYQTWVSENKVNTKTKTKDSWIIRKILPEHVIFKVEKKQR